MPHNSLVVGFRWRGLQVFSLSHLAPCSADQGEDFGKILAFVRMQIAQNYLAQKPPPPLAKLCYLLGYSEPSAASHFIKTQARAAR